MTTLTEALETGRGNERPFNCEKHDDHNASASVNVEKGVWYCFTCQASGGLTKSAPSHEALANMMDDAELVPVTRMIPLEMWADVIYDQVGYWSTRLGQEVARHYWFGTHPGTGAPVYLAWSHEHQAAVGFVTRHEGGGARYTYPRGFRASRNLFGLDISMLDPERVLPPRTCMLVESAADAAMLGSVGIYALGCYGSGLHQPQVELLRRVSPHGVLVAFDSDAAGQRGTEQAFSALTSAGVMAGRFAWPAKDPGEMTSDECLDAVRSFLAEERAIAQFLS